MLNILEKLKYIKKSKIIILAAITIFSLSALSIAQHDRRGEYGSDPLMIFETVVDEANGDGYAIQETALDGITDLEGPYERSYKISNTLDYVRKNLDPYMQWAIYAGLVLATIALIFSGFLLVTNSVHKQGDWTKIKTNIMHALLGVFLLSGFYFILKVIVALITSIFGGSSGDSGY